MKAKIFYGPAKSGKTRKANERANEIGINNTVFLDAKNTKSFNRDKFLFRDVTEDTKLIIIDDCQSDFNYNYLLSCITSSSKNRDEIVVRIWVEKRGEFPKEIEVPEIILTTESISNVPQDASTNARVEFIEFPLTDGKGKSLISETIKQIKAKLKESYHPATSNQHAT